MVDIGIKLTRRRVLASILVIGLATAAAGVGTFALFNDTATDGDNTITAGEMTLTVNESFSEGDLYPTQTTGNQTIDLTYTDGPTATLNIENVSTVDSTAPDLNWTDNLTVVNAYVGNQSYETSVSGTSLSDLEENDLMTIEQNDDIDFTVDLQLDGSAGNEFQSESVNISVKFNASQQR